MSGTLFQLAWLDEICILLPSFFDDAQCAAMMPFRRSWPFIDHGTKNVMELECHFSFIIHGSQAIVPLWRPFLRFRLHRERVSVQPHHL